LRTVEICFQALVTTCQWAYHIRRYSVSYFRGSWSTHFPFKAQCNIYCNVKISIFCPHTTILRFVRLWKDTGHFSKQNCLTGPYIGYGMWPLWNV